MISGLNADTSTLPCPLTFRTQEITAGVEALLVTIQLEGGPSSVPSGLLGSSLGLSKLSSGQYDVF